MAAQAALAGRGSAGAPRISPSDMATGAADAWGYAQSAEHKCAAPISSSTRCRRRVSSKALEVGCAQGFLSARLAARVERLIACDISPPPLIDRAREACRDRAQYRVSRRRYPLGAFPTKNSTSACSPTFSIIFRRARPTRCCRRTAAKTRRAGRVPATSSTSGAPARQRADRARVLRSPASTAQPEWERQAASAGPAVRRR